MCPLTAPPCRVTVVVRHTAASEEDAEEQAGGLAQLCPWPHGFLLFRMSLSWARKKVALTRGTLYSSALKRVLYVIFISQESGGAIPVQLFYLFEALACIEEEKIATCFLKKLLPV